MSPRKPKNPDAGSATSSISAVVVPIGTKAKAGGAPPRVRRAAVPRSVPPAAEATPGPNAPRAPKSGGTLKLRDLTERVATLTGAKKKAARQTVEAVLTVIGHALMAGDDLNLPPLGRARVSRQRDREDGEILMIRLKRGATGAETTGRKASKEALAATPEES